MTITQTGQIIALLKATYTSWKVEEGTIEAWHHFLSKFDFVDVMEAVDHFVGTSSSEYPPSVSQIIGTVVDIRVPIGPSPDQAWQNVLRAVGSEGYERIIKSNDSLNTLEWLAAHDIGWKEIAYTDERYRRPIEKDFKERYAEMVEQQRREYASGAIPLPPKTDVLEITGGE